MTKDYSVPAVCFLLAVLGTVAGALVLPITSHCYVPDTIGTHCARVQVRYAPTPIPSYLK